MFVLSLIIGVTLLNQCSGLTCLSCNQASKITDCLTQKAVCTDGSEECFLEKVILDDLSGVFSAGCRSKQVCDIIASSVGRKRQQESQRTKKNLIQCSQCCLTNTTNGIPCNGFLCNQNPVIVDTCLSCDSVSSPKLCLVSQQCTPNEVCVQRVFVRGGVVRYQLGCERKLLCDHLLKDYSYTHGLGQGRRANGDTDICSACCNTNQCNAEDCRYLIRKQKCNFPSVCGP
ncbi:uncharacterized protein LOC143044317 isoform X2 [Mytilus galloprovincialis]|uniref:uncharacterized protein LOC143044317 isoform X2 n=1 Tax=Mytilus galloprovincialis TaxID=29158 RepID=UPI003F7BA53E